MAFKLRLTTRAQLDIWEVISWYESCEEGLGERFDTKVNNMLFEISKKPTVYSYFNKDFRRAILKHFPYLIIFKVFEKEIVIYAIIYGGRNPVLINRKIN